MPPPAALPATPLPSVEESLLSRAASRPQAPEHSLEGPEVPCSVSAELRKAALVDKTSWMALGFTKMWSWTVPHTWVPRSALQRFCFVCLTLQQNGGKGCVTVSAFSSFFKEMYFSSLSILYNHLLWLKISFLNGNPLGSIRVLSGRHEFVLTWPHQMLATP